MGAGRLAAILELREMFRLIQRHGVPRQHTFVVERYDSLCDAMKRAATLAVKADYLIEDRLGYPVEHRIL